MRKDTLRIDDEEASSELQIDDDEEEHSSELEIDDDEEEHSSGLEIASTTGQQADECSNYPARVLEDPHDLYIRTKS